MKNLGIIPRFFYWLNTFMKVECVTKFDITKTGVSSRRNILERGDAEQNKKRQQQVNYETILQIIGLRSQPESISDPEIIQDLEMGKAWRFTFMIEHSAVFEDGNHELGHLYNDCNGVPMIINLDEEPTTGEILDCYSNKNIKFNILDHGRPF